jgi:integrase
MVLDYAVESGFINRNPARGIEGSRKSHLPRVELSDPRNVLLRDELTALAIHCEPYADLIMLMGTVGLRFNEAVALKGSDLDFDKNVITVQRTFSDLNGHLIEQSPKSGVARVIPLPDSLRPALLTRKLHAGPTGYLWVAGNGAPLRHSNFSRRLWKPALKAAGIEQRFTLHDLRHTAASWLVQSGCNISHLASMLGHQDSAVTLRRYTHLFSDDVQRISDLINSAESA